MKILITGGAGFIGSNLVEFFLKKGYSLTVIDNFSSSKKENLIEFENDIELIDGDIRDYNTVSKSLRGIEAVFHQAAFSSIPGSVSDPISCNDINITGTLNILEASRKNNVGRIVFASSSSVYGDTSGIPVQEEMILNPRSPFAVSKLSGENYMRVYADIYGMETICLRYFNVFGPKQNFDFHDSKVIPKFIKDILQGNQPLIYGDGEQSRNFTFVSDIVSANFLAVTAQLDKFGVAINCAGRERITLNNLVDSINKILHSDILPIYADPRKGDIKHPFAEIKLAENLLGYQPSVNFETGLEMTIEYFRQKLFDKMKY